MILEYPKNYPIEYMDWLWFLGLQQTYDIANISFYIEIGEYDSEPNTSY